MRAALLLLAAALAPALAAPVQEDPWTLRLNPFRQGFTGWSRTGPEKSFTWSDADQTVVVKGQSGKEPPRLVHSRIAWERGGMKFQAKKGAKKVRVVLLPAAGDGKPVALEFPRDAVGAANWTDLAMRITKGKAALFAPGPDGGEKEVASAEVPDGSRWRFGFEAPSGTDATLGMIRFERVYEEEPQFCEPEFQSLFDGSNVSPWRPGRPEDASVFRAEKGVLLGEPRVEDSGWLVMPGGWTSYELRMNALWGSNSLDLRAYEVPGKDGMINRFASVHVNFTDHLDPEGISALVVRVADSKVIASVNGKVILDTPLKHSGPTPISYFVARGRRCALRDIRIKDLAPGDGGGAPPMPRGGGGEKSEDPAKPAGWKGAGGAVEKDGGWSVEDAGDETGVVCDASRIGSYELRFKVGKGADGLAVVPRATRGLKRAPGIRLDASLFAAEEWTEVVLRVVLLKATVTVGGKDAGAMDLDHASGPPAVRVDAGGRASLKDLRVEAVR